MQPIRVFGFTTKADRIANVITTQAHIGQPFDQKSPPPKGDHKGFFAIWDTGATNSVISKRVVTECGLKPSGMTKVHTASGTDNVSTYLISMILPNKVVIPTLRVSEGNLTGTDVLIGMDIINQGDFAVTNTNGKTVFSFRMPSVECIDFVEKMDRAKQKKSTVPEVGRNSLCPCGSGKKYKKCCGKK